MGEAMSNIPRRLFIRPFKTQLWKFTLNKNLRRGFVIFLEIRAVSAGAFSPLGLKIYVPCPSVWYVIFLCSHSLDVQHNDDSFGTIR